MAKQTFKHNCLERSRSSRLSIGHGICQTQEPIILLTPRTKDGLVRAYLFKKELRIILWTHTHKNEKQSKKMLKNHVFLDHIKLKNTIHVQYANLFVQRQLEKPLQSKPHKDLIY